MASLILGSIGAVVGFEFGGPMGAQVGWMIGSSVGGILDRKSLPKTYGPRLGDRAVQTSTYGAGIPKHHGIIRLSGNVIWSTNLIETTHESDSGGKGSMGGPTQVSYTYSASFAICFSEGVMVGFRRIWADTKLIYDLGDWQGNPTTPAFYDGPINYTSGPIDTCSDVSQIRFYPGDEVQTPDPLIVADKGAFAPAFRGYCYMVFDNMQLANFGNRIPNISVE